jgi:hypothetical protein
LGKGSYIGTNMKGLSMIKDMVIRPLVIATEKVVEYYFPEDKPEMNGLGKNMSIIQNN